jgi:hypothetical protein
MVKMVLSTPKTNKTIRWRVLMRPGGFHGYLKDTTEWMLRGKHTGNSERKTQRGT